MPTKREYAISLGLAKEGRGRMSREAHAAIDKAISEGMTFDDPSPVVSVKPAKPKTDKPIRVARQPQGESLGPVADIATRYPDTQKFKGVDSKGKTHIVNARTVCVPCGYSLTSHRCNSPEALVASLEIVPVEEA